MGTRSDLDTPGSCLTCTQLVSHSVIQSVSQPLSLFTMTGIQETDMSKYVPYSLLAVINYNDAGLTALDKGRSPNGYVFRLS